MNISKWHVNLNRIKCYNLITITKPNTLTVLDHNHQCLIFSACWMLLYACVVYLDVIKMLDLVTFKPLYLQWASNNSRDFLCHNLWPPRFLNQTNHYFCIFDSLMCLICLFKHPVVHGLTTQWGNKNDLSIVRFWAIEKSLNFEYYVN